MKELEGFKVENQVRAVVRSLPTKVFNDERLSVNDIYLWGWLQTRKDDGVTGAEIKLCKLSEDEILESLEVLLQTEWVVAEITEDNIELFYADEFY